MQDPHRVAACTSAMAEASGLPVTVKCRIGVDDFDTYDWLCHFIRTVSENSPVRHFIIHARKAFLKGLSPAQNRTIPPLRREYALALARDFPHLQFTVNGVFKGCHDAAAAYAEARELGFSNIEGIMVGRAAVDKPWAALADADRALFGVENPCRSRRHVSSRLCCEHPDQSSFQLREAFLATAVKRPLEASMARLFFVNRTLSDALKEVQEIQVRFQVVCWSCVNLSNSPLRGKTVATALRNCRAVIVILRSLKCLSLCPWRS